MRNSKRSGHEHSPKTQNDLAVVAQASTYLAQAHVGTPEIGEYLDSARTAAELSAIPSAIGRFLLVAGWSATVSGDPNAAKDTLLRAYELARSVGNEFIAVISGGAVGVEHSPSVRFRLVADSIRQAFRGGPAYASMALQPAMQLLASYDRREEAATIAGFLLSAAGRQSSSVLDGEFGHGALGGTLQTEQPTAAARGGLMSMEHCVEFAVATATRIADELDAQSAAEH